MKTKLQNLKEQAAEYADNLRRSGEAKDRQEGLDRFAQQLGFGRYDEMIQGFVGKEDAINLDQHLQRSETLRAEFMRTRPQDKSEFGGQFAGKSAEEITREAQNQPRARSAESDDEHQAQGQQQNRQQQVPTGQPNTGVPRRETSDRNSSQVR